MRSENHTVGYVLTLLVELMAAQGMLEEHDDFRRDLGKSNENLYAPGLLGGYYIVIVCLLAGWIRNYMVAAVAM